MFQINNYKKIYCCNCGKLGHVFKNCLEPIISLGIVLYYSDNSSDNKSDIKFLMIRRKFTLGFMDFILGKYSLNNLDYIKRIFNEMTIHEKNRILIDNFNDLWYSVDYNNFDMESTNLSKEFKKKITNEYNISKNKFASLKSGFINSNGDYIQLNQIIHNCKYNWLEQEWEFPKGKRKMNESNLDAAIREFHEETDFPKDQLDIIYNDKLFIEKYHGSNSKKYKHIYFIAKALSFINYDDKPLTKLQDIEISQIGWFSFAECMSLIRPYQIEKKNILSEIKRFIIDNKTEIDK